MKILIVSSYFPPHLGGLEVVAQNQAKELARHGESVSVLTSAVGDKPGRQHHKDGYEIYRLSAWNFSEKFGAPFPIFSPKLLWACYKLIKNSDIVHIHDVFYISSWAAAFWAVILRRPLILTQHVALIPHPSKLVRFVQVAVYATMGRFILASSYKIIIFNGRVKDFLTNRRVSEQKLAVITNGTNLELFHPASLATRKALRKKYKLPSNKVLALFVGRFVPKKGFDKLIKSAGDDYTIVLAGGSTPAQHKSDKRLMFAGSLTQEELADMYRACDIFVLPSEGEGLPLSMQEAMASGLPIIAGDDVGYDLYEFDCNLLKFINPSVEEIKSSLRKVTHNSELRKAMSNYSAGYAKKNFKWGEHASKLHTLYTEALS